MSSRRAACLVGACDLRRRRFAAWGSPSWAASRSGIVLTVRCRSLVLAAISSLAILAVATPRDASAARISFTGCPAVIVYSARGSGEPLDDAQLGLGQPGLALYHALQRHFGAPEVGAEADGYSAVGVTFTPKNIPDPAVFLSGRYTRSVKSGVKDGIRDVTQLIATCGPRSHVVLTGYSQGAEVMRGVLNGLPAAAARGVSATVLFGDPNFSATEGGVEVAGGFVAGRSGLHRRADRVTGTSPQLFPSGIRGRVFSWCHLHDVVCQGSGNIQPHETYGVDASDASWQAAAEIQGTASYRLSDYGYGPVAWGARPAAAGRALGLTFDCSGGAVPGTCTCPSTRPDIELSTVFGGTRGLVAASPSSANGPMLTTTGIHIGSPVSALRADYPDIRFIQHGWLEESPATFYLYTREGHELLFLTAGGRISFMKAFVDAGWRTAEDCA